MKNLLKKIYSWFFLNLLPLPFNLLAHFIPKKKNLWVFGCWFGNKFSDNSKYLYLYCMKNHPEINIVWLTKNKDLILPLRKEGIKIEYVYSFKGFFYNLIAAVGICGTNCLTDLNLFCCSKKMKNVLLWHGQPLKRLSEDIELKNGNFFIKFLIKFIKFNRIFFLQSSTDLVVTSSENDRDIFRRCFCKNAIVTGYPRNDVFFDDKKLTYFENLKKNNCKNIIMYCPTFRGHPIGDICGTVDLLLKNLELIDSFFTKHDSVLLVKLHYVDQRKVLSVNNDFKNVIFINDEQIGNDINLALKSVDVLITDYSGIYFDYLLLNKPIVFFPFDYDYYKNKDRGFYYDYFDEKITPGPKAKNWDEILVLLEDLFNGNDNYITKRIEARKKFNKYNEGNNSERVFREILKIL